MTNENCKLVSKFFSSKSREYALTYMFLIDSSGVADEKNGHHHMKFTTKIFKKHQSELDAECIFIARY